MAEKGNNIYQRGKEHICYPLASRHLYEYMVGKHLTVHVILSFHTCLLPFNTLIQLYLVATCVFSCMKTLHIPTTQVWFTFSPMKYQNIHGHTLVTGRGKLYKAQPLGLKPLNFQFSSGW